MMRSNEYYSKVYISIVLFITIPVYLIFLVLSGVIVKDITTFSNSDVSTNFNKSFRQVVALEYSSFKEENSSNYSLSGINYNIDSMYLDWSNIEKERERVKESKLVVSRGNADIRLSSSNILTYGTMIIPSIEDTSFKGYMCLHKVTSKSSKQWEFLNSGKFELTTDGNGIMMYNNYYIVAMASYYNNYEIGTTFRVTLDSGIVFDVINGDIKADKDTDNSNTYRSKGSGRGEVIEFVIACGEEGASCNRFNTMSSEHRRLGNLSSLGFQGNIVKIEKLSDNHLVELLYK